MAFLLAFLVAISAGTWTFTKLQQRTGYGNNSSAIKGSVVAGLLLFVVVFMVGLMVL